MWPLVSPSPNSSWRVTQTHSRFSSPLGKPLGWQPPTYTANTILSGILQFPFLWKVSLNPNFSGQTSTSLVVKLLQRTFNSICQPYRLPLPFWSRHSRLDQGIHVFQNTSKLSRAVSACRSSYLGGWHRSMEISLGKIERSLMMGVRRRRRKNSTIYNPITPEAEEGGSQVWLGLGRHIETLS